VRSHRRAAVIAVVVVVGVVVAGFGLGIWALSRGPPTLSEAPISYLQAAAEAENQSNRQGDGPWGVDWASGLATPVALGTPQRWLYPFTNCPETTTTGADPNSTETIPGGNGSSTAGRAPFWSVILLNTTGSLRLFLVKGQVIELAYSVETSATCQPVGPPPLAYPAVVDSSAAVSAAWNAGGSGFVSSHTNVTLSMILTSGSSTRYAPGEWVIRWSTCAPPFLPEPRGTASGSMALYYVNATSGVVVDSFPYATGSCTSATPTPAIVALAR